MPDPLSRLELARSEMDRIFGRGYSRDHPESHSSCDALGQHGSRRAYRRTGDQDFCRRADACRGGDATNNPASTDHPSYGSRRALQRWAPVS